MNIHKPNSTVVYILEIFQYLGAFKIFKNFFLFSFLEIL